MPICNRLIKITFVVRCGVWNGREQCLLLLCESKHWFMILVRMHVERVAAKRMPGAGSEGTCRRAVEECAWEVVLKYSVCICIPSTRQGPKERESNGKTFHCTAIATHLMA